MLWEVGTWQALHKFTGHSDFVYAVAFAPSGEWFATVSKDRTGRIVNASTGKGVLTLSGMNDEVLAVAVDARGQVVTSGFETQLSWWDSSTAERLKRVGGPGIASHELAIDAKGAVCAVAGGDGSLRFYRPGGDLLKAARGDGAIFAVALDAAGKRAATGGADGTVKLWDVADARLLVTLWAGAGDQWLSLAPEGFVRGVAVEGGGAVVPCDDRSLAVDADDGVLRGSPECGERLVEKLALGGSRLQPEAQPPCADPRQEPGRERSGPGPRLPWEQRELQAPADRRNGEADQGTADGARESGDRDAECHGDYRAVQGRRAESQAHARLQGCAEHESSDSTCEWPSHQTRERWTFCGPTHQR